MGTPAPIWVVLNSSSGLSGKDELPDLLARRLNNPVIRIVEKGENPALVAREAIRQGAGTVVAGGGDGSINAVASTLTGTGVSLGVLPCGTLNHFARDLGLSLDHEEAVSVIAARRCVRVDVGEVNGHRFINNAIIGLYPAYRFRREREEARGRNKWFAIAAGVIGVLRRNPALRLKFGLKGQCTERQTPLLMVANNLHEMEGYRLGSRKSLTEGMLWATPCRA